MIIDNKIEKTTRQIFKETHIGDTLEEMIKKPIVGIIMGSDSDLSIMQEAAKVMEEFGIDYEISIISAHRTPKRASDYANIASQRGLKVIIAGAGGAAHLPGVLAAMTVLPVIGIPIMGKSLEGLDSLLSMVQMPAGIPVATVAINSAKNAGLLAIQILALEDNNLTQKLINYKDQMNKGVIEKATKLETLGYKGYLDDFNKVNN